MEIVDLLDESEEEDNIQENNDNINNIDDVDTNGTHNHDHDHDDVIDFTVDDDNDDNDDDVTNDRRYQSESSVNPDISHTNTNTEINDIHGNDSLSNANDTNEGDNHNHDEMDVDVMDDSNNYRNNQDGHDEVGDDVIADEIVDGVNHEEIEVSREHNQVVANIIVAVDAIEQQNDLRSRANSNDDAARKGARADGNCGDDNDDDNDMDEDNDNNGQVEGNDLENDVEEEEGDNDDDQEEDNGDDVDDEDNIVSNQTEPIISPNASTTANHVNHSSSVRSRQFSESNAGSTIQRSAIVSKVKGKPSVNEILDMIVSGLKKGSNYSANLSTMLRFLRENFSRCKSIRMSSLIKAVIFGTTSNVLEEVKGNDAVYLPVHLQVHARPTRDRNYKLIHVPSNLSFASSALSSGASSTDNRQPIRESDTREGPSELPTNLCPANVPSIGSIKAIECCNSEGRLIRIFRDIDDVRTMGIDVEAVKRCLQGLQPKFQGMMWRYRVLDQSSIIPTATPVSLGPRPIDISRLNETAQPPTNQDPVDHESDVSNDIESVNENESEPVVDVAMPVTKSLPTRIKAPVLTVEDLYLGDPLVAFILKTVTSESDAVRGITLTNLVDKLIRDLRVATRTQITSMVRKCAEVGWLVESYRPDATTTIKGRKSSALLYYVIDDDIQKRFVWGIQLVSPDGLVIYQHSDLFEMCALLNISRAVLYRYFSESKDINIGDLMLRLFVKSSSRSAVTDEIDLVPSDELLKIISEARLVGKPPLILPDPSRFESSIRLGKGNRRRLNNVSNGPKLASMSNDLSVDKLTDYDEEMSVCEIGPHVQATLPSLLSPQPFSGDIDLQTPITSSCMCLHAVTDWQLAGGSDNFEIFIDRARHLLHPCGLILRIPSPCIKYAHDEIVSLFACVISGPRGPDTDRSSQLQPGDLMVFDGKRTIEIPMQYLCADEELLLEAWHTGQGVISVAMEQVRQRMQMRLLEQSWTELEIRSFSRLSARMKHDRRSTFFSLVDKSLLRQTRSRVEIVNFHHLYLAQQSLDRTLFCLKKVFGKALEIRSSLNGQLDPSDHSIRGGNPYSMNVVLPKSVLDDNWDVFFGVKYVEDAPQQPLVVSSRHFQLDPKESNLGPAVSGDDPDGGPVVKKRPVEQYDLSTGKVVKNLLTALITSINRMSGETVRIFRSGRQAAEALGTHSTYILKCCHGVKKSVGGYCFRFYDSVSSSVNLENPAFVSIEEIREKMANSRGIRKRQRPQETEKSEIPVSTEMDIEKTEVSAFKRPRGGGRAVEQLSPTSDKVIRTFETATAAAQHFRVANMQQRISMCCRGVQAMAGGFKWRFAPENTVVTANEGDVAPRKASISQLWIQELCVEAISYLNERRGSTVEAIRAYIAASRKHHPRKIRYFQLRVALDECIADGKMVENNKKYSLTAQGMAAAIKVLRSHTTTYFRVPRLAWRAIKWIVPRPMHWIVELLRESDTAGCTFGEFLQYAHSIAEVSADRDVSWSLEISQILGQLSDQNIVMSMKSLANDTSPATQDPTEVASSSNAIYAKSAPLEGRYRFSDDILKAIRLDANDKTKYDFDQGTPLDRKLSLAQISVLMRNRLMYADSLSASSSSDSDSEFGGEFFSNQANLESNFETEAETQCDEITAENKGDGENDATVVDAISANEFIDQRESDIESSNSAEDDEEGNILSITL